MLNYIVEAEKEKEEEVLGREGPSDDGLPEIGQGARELCKPCTIVKHRSSMMINRSLARLIPLKNSFYLSTPIVIVPLFKDQTCQLSLFEFYHYDAVTNLFIGMFAF